jgi:hypothetical protein
MGAGDGTRTRDSLLGRQGVTKSLSACYELAYVSVSDKRCHVQIWCLRQKMLRTDEGRISRAQSALEQLYQNFGANSREAGGLPLITTSFFSPKLLLFLPNVCHHVDHFQRKQDRQGRLLVKRCGVGYRPLMQVGAGLPAESR